MVNKHLFEIKIRKPITIFLYTIALVLFSLELFLASMPENKFSLKRDFDIVIKQTGFEFPFNDNDRKEFDNYHK